MDKVLDKIIIFSFLHLTKWIVQYKNSFFFFIFFFFSLSLERRKKEKKETKTIGKGKGKERVATQFLNYSRIYISTTLLL